jgi:hypothetical protein
MAMSKGFHGDFMVISWSSKGLYKGNMVFLINQFTVYIYICLFTGQISPISSDIHTSVGNVHGIYHKTLALL